MRYVIGAAIGAVLALLLGVPSFNVDRYTESEPPLFSTYCDLERTAWEGECVPSAGGTLGMVVLGAAVGAIAAAALRRRKSTSDTADESSPGARSGPIPDGGAVDRRRREKDKARDDVVLAAAQEISAAIERRRDSTVHQTIQRKSATGYISDEVRDRGTRLAIVNLAGTAVDRALEMGWLRSQDEGPDQLLSRTSRPLPAASDSTGDAPVADGVESTAAESEKPHEDAEVHQDQVPAAKRTGSLEELESLIRLHERGILTDAELEAAKARLVGRDNG